MPTIEGQIRVRPEQRFAVVASRWNPAIVDALVAAAVATLRDHGAAGEQVTVVRVPGAWEIPQACERLATTGAYDGLIALGCVVRGDTRHYEHVADGCAQALMQVALDCGTPVINGVLAVERHEDALARAGGAHGNKGEEAALAAIEMVDLLEQLA